MSTEIDWEQQWNLYANDFRDGKAHVPLTPRRTIQLEPGPGFGDFSHPTTRLMIEMMRPFVANRHVFDIGCGSGILAICAAALGALSTSICDVDREAVAHALGNASLNGVQIVDQQPRTSNLVILMNMIASEQRVAWNKQGTSFSTLITSGILPTERSHYLSFAKTVGWHIDQEFELEGWLGFVFKESLK